MSLRIRSLSLHRRPILIRSGTFKTIVLKLPDDGGESPVRPKVMLMGSWAKTPIDENDSVRVIGTF